MVNTVPILNSFNVVHCSTMKFVKTLVFHNTIFKNGWMKLFGDMQHSLSNKVYVAFLHFIYMLQPCMHLVPEWPGGQMHLIFLLLVYTTTTECDT